MLRAGAAFRPEAPPWAACMGTLIYSGSSVLQEKKKRRLLWRRGMRVLTATNGNNALQGPMRSQRGLEDQRGWSSIVLVLATKAFAKRTRRGSSGLYFHMPHPTPSWGPRKFFFGRCLQDEAGESISPPHPPTYTHTQPP